jgi:hypothetical protein
MRFWITKNSELPVREQLVRQVLLGILSEDPPSGHKLPSVRAAPSDPLQYRERSVPRSAGTRMA